MLGFIGNSPTVSAYLLQLPLYAVWIVGICLCLTRWRRHPKVCEVALAGFSLMFLESLFGTLLSYNLLPRMSNGRGMWVYYSIWLIRALIQAGLWGFILAAVFGWRDAGRAGGSERATHPGD